MDPKDADRAHTWTQVREDRWRDEQGNTIIRETKFPRSYDELLRTGSKTTYALKTPERLWCDVESYPTFEDAAASAERTGTERENESQGERAREAEPNAPEK